MFTDHLCCRKTVAARSLDKSFLMVRGWTGMTIDQDAQAGFQFRTRYIPRSKALRDMIKRRLRRRLVWMIACHDKRNYERRA